MYMPPSTDLELERARETVLRTRAEQGLPPDVEDPVVADQVARLLTPDD
jgi:hypothetical protein